MGHRWVRHVFLSVENYQTLTHILSQKEITKIQCDILISNFKNPKTIALVKENIERISKGSSSHCGGALNLALEKAFKYKPKKPDPVGVKLRCSRSDCQWYNNHLSYSSIGLMAIYCQLCIFNSWGTNYLQCTGCGSNRTSTYAECQLCNKPFI